MIVLILALLQQGCSVTENPVHPPLLFLARHQNEDGSWGARPKGCACPDRFPVGRSVRLPISEAVEREFRVLLNQLEDEQSIAREQAQRAIIRLGAEAVPLLQAQLRHPDPEVRERCRDTLDLLWTTDPGVRERWDGGSDLRATSLALLAFIGSGYLPLSRDRLVDPVLNTSYDVGDVTKRAMRWLLSKQNDEGSFAPDDPVANALAALAIIELYGMTAIQKLRWPAENAVSSLLTGASTDRSFLIWKGIALFSASISELPVDRARLKEVSELLSKDASPPGTFGEVLVARLAGTPGNLKGRFPEGLSGHVSPEERWIAATAARLVWGKKSEEWLEWRKTLPFPPKQLRGDSRCERGSGALPFAAFEEGLRAAAFQVLLLHRSYHYAHGLLENVRDRD